MKKGGIPYGEAELKSEFRYKYVIGSKELNDEGDCMFWSTDTGWGSYLDATEFLLRERRLLKTLPAGSGGWIVTAYEAGYSDGVKGRQPRYHWYSQDYKRHYLHGYDEGSIKNMAHQVRRFKAKDLLN